MEKINRLSRDGKSITIARFSKEGDKRTIEVSTSYHKAGISYWDYHRYPSGYRLSYMVCEVENNGGFECVRTVIGDKDFPSCYFPAGEAERFSRKELQRIANDQNTILTKLDDFCQNYGLGSGWK